MGPGKDSAFTLIELLTVIAIILILAALLFSVLNKGIGRAQRVSCLNSLRQWMIADNSFAAENDDSLPRDGMGQNGLYPGNTFNGSQTGHPTDPRAWFNTLVNYVAAKPLSESWSGGSTDFQENSKGFPFPGNKEKIWHCASAKMSASDNVAGGGKYGFFSLVMNIDLKKKTQTANWDYPQMPRMSSFKKPSQTVLMFDAVFNPRNEIVNLATNYNSVNPANRWRSFAWRHEKGGNIGFMDGHTGYFKTTDVQKDGGPTYEGKHPKIIWNAPYRDANP
jgi:prepilin-type N-terminal cleavage/methylation domain-containing protein/prepilin-type processing-associated H-X9-DG protein